MESGIALHFVPLRLARKLTGARRFPIVLEMAEKVDHLVAYFGGRVQGVGFRYSTLQVARGYEVAGTVQNLLDGRVRLEVEGRATELRAFLAEIQRQMEAFVRETEEHWGCREASLRGFRIC